MNNINVLEIFAGSGKLGNEFRKRGYQVTSIDIKKYKQSNPDTIICDILDYKFWNTDQNYYNYIFVGLPCQTYSKAAGNFHFSSNFTPKTYDAIKSIIIFNCIVNILTYHFNAKFIIENPTGKLFRCPWMRSLMSQGNMQIIRLFQSQFGFVTPKQTDLFTNITTLVLVDKFYRKNATYSKTDLSNLSTNKRHTYTESFCSFLVDLFESSDNGFGL